MPMDQHLSLNGVALVNDEATLRSLGIRPGSLLLLKVCYSSQQSTRLRVVSNFGGGECGASEIHTRAKCRGNATLFLASLTSRLLEISRARVCISLAPQSPSPKLETTRCLTVKKEENFHYTLLYCRKFWWRECLACLRFEQKQKRKNLVILFLVIFKRNVEQLQKIREKLKNLSEKPTINPKVKQSQHSSNACQFKGTRKELFMINLLAGAN